MCGEGEGGDEAAYGLLLSRVFKAFRAFPDHQMEDIDM